MDDAVGWLVALGFCFFTFRYFFGSDSTSRPGSGTAGGRVVPQAAVDQVKAMFPHISEGAVRYALQASRGNVESVVERVLRDGALPEPPAGFFQSIPSQAAAAAAEATRPSSTSTSTLPNGPPSSLITRLGLQARAAEEPSTSEAQVSTNADLKGKGKGKAAPAWETTMEGRERSLKERKERMVLEARRKLLEKEKARVAKQALEGEGTA